MCLGGCVTALVGYSDDRPCTGRSARCPGGRQCRYGCIVVCVMHFFFMRSLLDTQQARTRNQPHATPEGALDTTREQALTETGVPQPAVTRAAHNAAGPPRGALYSDTDREVWLTAGHTTGHTHATARRNATDGGTRLTASPTDSSDWRPAQRSLLRTPACRPQPSRASF